MAGLAGELSFWINAFIPQTVPGYTITITKGANAGKSGFPFRVSRD
jgi:hypothetical protein